MFSCQALRAIVSLQKEDKRANYYYIVNYHRTELRVIKSMCIREGIPG